MRKNLISLIIALFSLHFSNAQTKLECQFITDFFGGTPYSLNIDTLISNLGTSSNYIADTTTVSDPGMEVLFSSHIIENQCSILKNYNGFVRIYKMPYTGSGISSTISGQIYYQTFLTYAAVYDIPNKLTKKELKSIMTEMKEGLTSKCALKLKKGGKWIYTSKVDGIEIELLMSQFKESDPYTLWLVISQTSN